MGLDEGTFGVEMELDDKPYLWADKYRPRKPRYFNRVHTVSNLSHLMVLGLQFKNLAIETMFIQAGVSLKLV